jgi:hypothetical protein
MQLKFRFLQLVKQKFYLAGSGMLSRRVAAYYSLRNLFLNLRLVGTQLFASGWPWRYAAAAGGDRLEGEGQ